ncbi:MAG: septal ring lytic transglycosylase RlpA family protein [Devosia sp.]
MVFADRCGWKPAARFLGLMAVLGPLLAACATTPHHGRGIFSSKEFGVPASRRVTNNPNPPHGGGVAMVGQPYRVHGQWYQPKANPAGYDIKGVASYYGWDFHGRLTANGEIFSANAITGGSPDLPLPSYARVTNLENGRSMLVRFNDRGPYMAGRVADLSLRTAQLLGFANAGTAKVRIQYVGPAPLNGDDTRYLMASLNQATPSYDRPTTRLASIAPAQMAPRPLGNRTPPRRSGDPEMRNVLASVDSLFSYADAAGSYAEPGSAQAAADALANGAFNGALDDNALAELPDDGGSAPVGVDGGQAVNMPLGTFADAGTARRTAMQFAVLGAVDEEAVPDENGALATRLTLTRLKPGVGRQDVLDLVQTLGLRTTISY